MENWSPLTRRCAALCLLVGLISLILLYLVLPLASSIHTATANLADARFELARLQQIESRPDPPRADPVPADLVAGGPTVEAAARTLEAVFQAAAGTAAVTIDHLEMLPQTDGRSGQLRMQIQVSGEEAQVRQFIAAIETGRPMIRFRPWRLTPDGDKLRFEATAISPWRKVRP